jgi:hypothetical protein
MFSISFGGFERIPLLPGVPGPVREVYLTV